MKHQASSASTKKRAWSLTQKYVGRPKDQWPLEWPLTLTLWITPAKSICCKYPKADWPPDGNSLCGTKVSPAGGPDIINYVTFKEMRSCRPSDTFATWYSHPAPQHKNRVHMLQGWTAAQCCNQQGGGEQRRATHTQAHPKIRASYPTKGAGNTRQRNIVFKHMLLHCDMECSYMLHWCQPTMHNHKLLDPCIE